VARKQTAKKAVTAPTATPLSSSSSATDRMLASDASLRPVVVDEHVLLMLVALAAGFGLLWAIRGVLLPLLFVGVATFLGAPAVAALQRRGVPRAVGAALVLASAGLVLLALAAMVLPALVRDLVDLVRRAPDALRSLAVKFEALTGVVVPTNIKGVSDLATTAWFDQLSSVAANGGALMGQGALGLVHGATSALGFVAQALIVPIITFFVLTELPEAKRVAWALWPARARGVMVRYLPLVDDALSGLVRGQLTVALIMAGLYAVGLAIAGVPSALAISVLAGAAYVIPFASATVCLILAAAFSLLELGTGATWPMVGALITAGAVQLIEGYLLTPRIVGEKAGLSPLATLLAVLCGGSAAGFLGVLFALPVGAVVAIVVRDVARQRLSSSPVLSAVSSEVSA
jgi:predicted PurR-regulated permease PerM